MDKLEYIRYALSKGFLKRLDWYFAMLSIPADKVVDGKYFMYDNGTFYMKIDETKSKLSDTGEAPMGLMDELKLKAGDLPNIHKDMISTVGIFMANYVLVTYPFKDKIDYINGEVKIKAIEAIIAENLVKVPKEKTDLTIDEYKKFARNADFLTNLSRIVSIASTPKALIAPPGIEAYKAKIIKEMKEKYGEDVFTNYSRVAELETKLKEYDKEFLKDDPSYGKMLSGKVVNVARKKLFLTYGAEEGFDRSGKAKLVENSLTEGWPTDPEELAVMYNASRAGSYDRGSETQKGGTTGKIIPRATNSVIIIEGDCGTKKTRKFAITKNNYTKLRGRNIMDKGKLVSLDKDNIESYIGKIVDLRSPSRCEQSGSNFCSACMGPKMIDYKEGISLLLLGITALLLDISMASMHAKELKTVLLDMNEQIS